MNDSRVIPTTLPPELGLVVHDICNRFESAWQAGDRPRIDDYADGIAETARPALLRELILLDADYRRLRGERVSADDYRGLFASGGPGWLDRELFASDRAGRYRLDGEIGRGGMGAVYRAFDPDLGRELAVKVLHESYRDNDAARERFLKESHVTARLQHPNIPPVHEQGALADGRPFFAMKLVRGRTLDALLSARPSPSGELSRFVQIFAQVCQGVAYAHSRGIIHRDLKPHNVMVGEFGEVQVMDWGLAKVLGGESANADEPAVPLTTPPVGEPHLGTEAGAVMGSLPYLPPEQARGEVAAIDRRSDVFSLGAVLCEILTGRPAYAGGTVRELLAKAERADVAEAFTRLDGCGAHADLVGLCRRCLAAGREERPKDAGEVADAVAAYQAEVEARLREAEMERQRQQVQALERRKRQRVQIALIATVFGIVLLGCVVAVIADLWQQAETARMTAKSERDDEQKRRELGEGAERKRGRRIVQQVVRDTFGSVKSSASEARQIMKATLKREKPDTQSLFQLDRFHLWKQGVVTSSYGLAGSQLLTASGNTARIWDVTTGKPLLALAGHVKGITAAAFGPDGSRVVTGSWDHTARVWDAKTGKLTLTLVGHTDTVTSTFFSPDGSRIVTAGADNSARLWDAKTGKALFALPHTNRVTAATFSRDGTRVATADWDKTARIFDAGTGGLVLVIRGHADLLNSVAFSPDGTRVVTAGEDRTARIWNTKSGEQLLVFEGHTNGVTDASFSPDGSRIVTAGWDKSARVWDARTGKPILRFEGHSGGINSASFCPDGSRVVTASEDGTVKIWDAMTGKTVYDLKQTPDGKGPTVVMTEGPLSTDRREYAVKVWDSKSGVEVSTLEGHTDTVVSAAFSPVGSLVFTGSKDRTARVWDAKTGKQVCRLALLTEIVVSAAFSPDGSLIVTVAGKTARVWDAKTGAELQHLGEHTGSVGVSSFTPDGTRLVTASGKSARVWEVKTGKPVLGLDGHADTVNSAAFSPDGSRVVTAGRDKTAMVWDVKTGAVVHTFAGHLFPVIFATYSTDGSRILTSEHRALKVWDAKSGAVVSTINGRSRYASFSPNGKTLVMAEMLSVKAWDTSKGTEAFALARYNDIASAISFSPDGSRILTAGTTARVWDAKTGAELLRLKGHKGMVGLALFSPDGSRIVTAGNF